MSDPRSDVVRRGLQEIDAFVETTLMEIREEGSAVFDRPDVVARIFGDLHVLSVAVQHVLDRLDET